MHEGKVDLNTYPYIKDKPVKIRTNIKIGVQQQKSKGSAIDFANNPRLFAFIIGGISHHEIVSISNL